MPARWLKSSVTSRDWLAVPGVAYLILSGCDFANAMNSGNVFAGTELLTTNKNGSLTRILIGAKSRSVSYGSFTFVTGEIVCEEATTSNVYPSGADFATASVPMIPLAPVRFSMMIG